jgi:hypothetical protein
MSKLVLHSLALAVTALAASAGLAQTPTAGGTGAAGGTTGAAVAPASGAAMAGSGLGGRSGGTITSTPSPMPAPPPAPPPNPPARTGSGGPALDLRQARLVEPSRPDKLTNVGGNGSPSVAFNRRSIGPTADLPTAERARAYQTLDRAALKESLAAQAQAAGKAGEAAKAADLTRRAEAIRLRHHAKDLHNNKQFLPTHRPATAQGRLVMIEGRPYMVPSQYQALVPPKPPGTSQMPKWQTHRLLVEKADPAAAGHTGQRAYWTRHYEDSIGAKARAHALKNSKFPRAAAALMRHRGFVRIQ